jgi:uncharacterized membrane protein
MTKSRLEAFSDGVLAIILTIMVLELHWPKDPSLGALRDLAPALAGYLLSFVFVGIYWVNHHHTFQVVHKVNGAVLWANLHLLFWLSLVPLATGWMAEGGMARLPVLFYGVILLGSALAYTIMIRTLVALEGPGSLLAQAIGADLKGYASLALYLLGIGLAWADWTVGAYACYVAVALLWLVPDSRIEKRVAVAGAPPRRPRRP